MNLTQTPPNIHQKIVQVLKEEYLYPIRRESLMLMPASLRDLSQKM